MKLLKPHQFPKLIPVGKTEYHVTFAKKLPGDILGVCYFDMKLIVLSRNQSLEELNATFWHEVLHAIEYELNIDLGHRRINKLEWAIVRALTCLPEY